MYEAIVEFTYAGVLRAVGGEPFCVAESDVELLVAIKRIKKAQSKKTASKNKAQSKKTANYSRKDMRATQ